MAARECIEFTRVQAVRRHGRGASWFLFLPEWSIWSDKCLSQEKKRRTLKKVQKRGIWNWGWESGGESLQTLFPPCYHILPISVRGAFPHCGYLSLQVDLFLLKHAWVVGEGSRWAGAWKSWKQRWVVIRNITVIGGLSFHISCWSIFWYWQLLWREITPAAN